MLIGYKLPSNKALLLIFVADYIFLMATMASRLVEAMKISLRNWSTIASQQKH